MMAEICQKVLDGFGMPVDLALSIVDSIIKGKGDIRNCSCYRVAKLLELERLCRVVSVDEMQSCSMPESNNGCCVYPEKDARRVSYKRKKAVYVLCGHR